jgi:YggT family protein
MNTVLAISDFIIYYVLGLVILLIIAYAVISWLIAFNVVNTHNRFVQTIVDVLERIVNPLLRPIRKVLPDFGGIDLSPMVLWLFIWLIQNKLYPAILRDLGIG